jgi:hypothetical protein
MLVPRLSLPTTSPRSPLGPRTPRGGVAQATPKHQATMTTPLPVDHLRGATVRVRLRRDIMPDTTLDFIDLVSTFLPGL